MTNEYVLPQRVVALEARVVALEQKVAFLLAELQLTDKFHALPAPADAGVMSLVQQGKMIQAISLYRQKHNASLVEAKNAVDAMLAPART